MMSNLTQTTLDYLAAREAFEAAEKAKKQAEVALKAAFAESGVDYNVVNGKKITITRKGRRSYDAAALAGMLSAAMFRKITKPTVDSKAFEAAVTLGSIKPEVAEAATTVTEYDEIRVTGLAAEKGSAAVKAA